MLQTPLGEILVTLDGEPLPYRAEPLPPNHLCPELSGRCSITLELAPDGREHRLACRLRDWQPKEEDTLESCRDVTAKSFTALPGCRLTLAMTGDSGYVDGQRLSAFDYDTETLPDGVQYVLLPATRTGSFTFGLAWRDFPTPEDDIQTLLGADPLQQKRDRLALQAHPGASLADAPFAKTWPALAAADGSTALAGPALQSSFPPTRGDGALRLLEASEILPEQDLLLQVSLSYRRTLLNERPADRDGDGELLLVPPHRRSWGQRTEQLFLDRAAGTLEYRSRDMGEERSFRCVDRHRVGQLFEALEGLRFPLAQPQVPEDILPEQDYDQSYTVTALYSRSGPMTLTGRLDRWGRPCYYPDFCELVLPFSPELGCSEMLDEAVCDALPRRASDLYFCFVNVKDGGPRRYTYLCHDPDIREDSWVFVPFGRNNETRLGLVVDTCRAQPEDSPYPLAHTKAVIKECTQEDLALLEQKEKQLFPCAHLDEDRRHSTSSHYCPLLGKTIFYGGRGGCRDVECILDGDRDLLRHFDPPFDPDSAWEVCDECGWQDEPD